MVPALERRVGSLTGCSRRRLLPFFRRAIEWEIGCAVRLARTIDCSGLDGAGIRAALERAPIAPPERDRARIERE